MLVKMIGGDVAEVIAKQSRCEEHWPPRQAWFGATNRCLFPGEARQQAASQKQASDFVHFADAVPAGVLRRLVLARRPPPARAHRFNR